MAERPAPTTAKAPSSGSPAGSSSSGSSTGSSNGTSAASSNGVSEDTAVRSTSPETRQAPTIPPPPAPAPAAKAAKPSREQKRDAKRDSKASSGSTSGSGDSVAAGTSTATASRPKATRRARLRLTRIDPWSVMKTAFLLSIAFGVVTVVSVAMVWQVLGAAGVWDSINSTIQETIGGPDTAAFDVQDYVGTSRVMGFTMLVAAVDVVLLTAVATLGAFLYNMAAALLGGIEVTLAEDPS